MMILGLDIASKTGWALYDPKAPISAIRSGSFTVSGNTPEEKAASLAGHLIKLFKFNGVPQFAVIEQPIRTAPLAKKTQNLMGLKVAASVAPAGLNAVILSNQLVGGAVALIRGYGIAWEMVSSSTWRKGAFGFGRKPGMDRAGWKRLAKERCQQLKIDVSNADEAEAVFIAMAGPNCQRFKMLQAKANAA